MRKPINPIRRLPLVSALAAALLLGGCGGIELEGPGFEKLGLTSKKNKGDKKVPDRAPLLIPPDRARLPEPAVLTASTPPQNWPVDPESTIEADAAAAKKKKKEYVDNGDWSKKAGIDEFEKLMDPAARRAGIFGGNELGKENRGGDDPNDAK